MFAPVIHTYGAISSVRNVLCVYLWLQNPPDRGRLIFMGSVNRDFVFRELQAGKQTHNSHMDAPHTNIEEGGNEYIWQVTYCTATCACRGYMQTLECSDKLNAIWQTVLQKHRRIPRVYIAGDSLIICSLSPSLLLSTPQQQHWLLH